jgi:signal transduction histidine kinase
MEPRRLVEGRMARLNRGLLALRLGLYAALVGSLLSSATAGSVQLATVVAILAVVPALPVRFITRHRIETGIAISLGVEAWLWTGLGSLAALELFPVFAVLVAGLLLSRRAAGAVTTAAVAIQVGQLAMWRFGLVDIETTAAGLIGDVVLVIVAGVGFLEIGAVLREYQARAIEQSREEIRLTELIDGKDRLIDSVAHELRTPLTVVLGLSSELATDTFGVDESSTLAGMVAEEARRLAGIIDNMVVAARSDIDRLPTTPEAIDLAQLATEVWAAMSTSSVGCTVEGDAMVVGDRRRLVHLLTNLFDNACRHGRPPVTVELETRGGTVKTVIRDGGGGVAIGSAVEVFERYRSGGDDHRPDNLGLGLPVARTLARHMGGDLEVVDGWATLSLPAAARTEMRV